MNDETYFVLKFECENDRVRLSLSDNKNTVAQRPLPGDIFKFMAAAQHQLDSVFENHIPVNKDRQQEWGTQLVEHLFGDNQFLAPVLEVVRDAGNNADFRLFISSHQAEALHFPWELCYVDGLGFLGTSGKLVPVRLPIERKLKRDIPVRDKPLRVLVYVCAPEDAPEDKALEYELEQEFILEIFDQLVSKGLVDLHTPPEGDLKSLAAYLETFKPHVLHLSGHAIYQKSALADQKGGFFLFETPEGLTDPVPTAKLSATIREKHRPALVVLAACQTAQGMLEDLPGMAQSLLNAGVPHVVGMNHSVPDLKATDWTQNFYQALVQGKTIHSAVGNARHTLFSDRKKSAPAAWCIPVLYARHTFTRLTAQPLQQGPPTVVAKDELEVINGVPFHRRGFIGRRREQRELLKVLRCGERNGVLITALGGEGKSALAIRLAKILEADDDYQLLVYKTSEYEETFLEPLEPLISAHPRLTELRRTKTDAELLDILVQQVLPHAKIVLLLDNFEVLLDQQNRFRSAKTRQLLQKLMQVSSGDFRLLITSRREFKDVDISDNVRVYPLPSLSRAETIKKINRLKPLHALSFEQKKDIHVKLGGSPKVVELLNGYFEQKPDLERCENENSQNSRKNAQIHHVRSVLRQPVAERSAVDPKNEPAGAPVFEGRLLLCLSGIE